MSALVNNLNCMVNPNFVAFIVSEISSVIRTDGQIGSIMISSPYYTF